MFFARGSEFKVTIGTVLLTSRRSNRERESASLRSASPQISQKGLKMHGPSDRRSKGPNYGLVCGTALVSFVVIGTRLIVADVLDEGKLDG
jgi:hypothetical protein